MRKNGETERSDFLFIPLSRYREEYKSSEKKKKNLPNPFCFQKNNGRDKRMTISFSDTVIPNIF
jgi:hypothetical protein